MPKGNRQLFEHLILAVQSREELYNPYCRGYKDRNTCDQAWRYVAQATGLSPAEAKRTWSTLRSSYSRSLHNEQLSRGHNLPARTRWYLTSHMDFLRPFLSNRDLKEFKLEDGDMEEEGEINPDHHSFSLENISQGQVAALEGFGNGLETGPPSTSPSSAPSNVDNSPLPTALPPVSSFESLTKRPKLEFPQSSPGFPHFPEPKLHFPVPDAAGSSTSSPNVLEEDPDILFFRSLLPCIRELSKKRQRELKLSISKLVYDQLAEEEEETAAAAQRRQNGSSPDGHTQKTPSHY